MQAVQQSNIYLGQSQHAMGPSMLPHPLPPLPMHAPLMGYAAPYGHAPYGQGAPMQSVVSADGSTLRLRGLPYSAGVDEITSFFAGDQPYFTTALRGCPLWQLLMAALMSCQVLQGSMKGPAILVMRPRIIASMGREGKDATCDL